MMQSAALVDSHVHLDWFPPDALDGILGRAEAAGVVKMITVGADLPSSRQAVEIAGRYAPVLAAVGVHPTHLVAEMDSQTIDTLRRMVLEQRVVAIGEVGLDSGSGKVSLEVQERACRRQLRLAAQEGLPVLLHVRGAFDRLFDVLEQEDFPGRRAVVHYFVGSAELAQSCVQRGLYLSFGKPLTRSPELQGVAATVPAEQLLIETDAYPREPHRWTEPADVRLVAEKMAEVRGLTVAAVGQIVSQNLARLLTRAR